MPEPAPVRHASFAGRIGLATCNITPPVGAYWRNWGAAEHDQAGGIHRPLLLTALTLQTAPNDPPCVLVDADLSWWRSMPLARKFRSRVTSACELTDERFIFAVSHSHAAAVLAEPEPDWPGGDLLREYLDELAERTIATIKEALTTAAPSRMEWHSGRCQLARNRDLPDPQEGSTRRICGFRPHAPADDTLLVARITAADGQLRGVLANYACHPTTLAWENELVSPDYLGAYRETIAQTTGATALFLQGASGELAPRYQYVADPGVADAHGRQLAYATLATLSDMEPPGVCLQFDRVQESGAPLAVWKRQTVETGDPASRLRAECTRIKLPLKDWPSADELEQQRQAETDRTLRERLLRKRNVRRELGDGDTYALPVWTWQLGEAYLVGTHCESYSWLQQELRRRQPATPLAVVNLINGSLGYLPPAELYDEDIYQIWQTPFARGSLEQLAAHIESRTPAYQSTTEPSKAS